jgi:SAM-dependent methyltransferase
MNTPEQPLFEQYLAEFQQVEFSGWDFSVMGERWVSENPPWDYLSLAGDKVRNAGCVLDMGTGGGEALSQISNLPPATFATEGYPPNVRVAHQRLSPLGIHVVQVDGQEDHLPFAADSFSLVLNRHESFNPVELHRILQPGGRFLTQQVGGRDNFRLNELLQNEPSLKYADCLPEPFCAAMEAAGLVILNCLQAFPKSTFKDLGAVLFYLKVITWQIEDFNIEEYRPRLEALHRRILDEGGLQTTQHRFLIEALKPL